MVIKKNSFFIIEFNFYVCKDFVIAARQIGLGHLGESVARSTFRKLDKNRNGRLDMT